MDLRLGQVLDAIKEAGVEDNTIVVFSSDNAGGGLSGGAGIAGGSNGPFRGNFFYTPYEGSMRVPAMVRWPGKVPAGVVTDQIFAAVDWLPTLAALAGASDRVPKDRPIDGKDASAFLQGKSPTTVRDSCMFFGTDGELMSVKWQYCKMVLRYAQGPALEATNQVEGPGGRARGWLCVHDRRTAGLREPARLLGILGTEPPRGLRGVRDGGDPARRAEEVTLTASWRLRLLPASRCPPASA